MRIRSLGALCECSRAYVSPRTRDCGSSIQTLFSICVLVRQGQRALKHIASTETHDPTKASGENAKSNRQCDRISSCEEIPGGEKAWEYTGNGCWLETCIRCRKHMTTSLGGPKLGDISFRKTIDRKTGKAIDECCPEDTRTDFCIVSCQRRPTIVSKCV